MPGTLSQKCGRYFNFRSKGEEFDLKDLPHSDTQSYKNYVDLFYHEKRKMSIRFVKIILG